MSLPINPFDWVTRHFFVRCIQGMRNVSDWLYLIPAVIAVECIVLFLTKYPGANPYFKVHALQEWYSRFGIVAVMSDVLSILIGIMFARYIYTYLKLDGFLSFLVVLLAFQLFHDILFYVCVIRPLPIGHNQMIDVFKKYAQENGNTILIADALMMVSSVVLGSILQSLPAHYVLSSLFLTLYALTYILFTN